MSGAPILPDVALDVWRFAASECTQVQVAPDGCRDLIVVQPCAGAPTTLVSALSDTVDHPVFAAGDRAIGVRLRPGVRIDEASLHSLLGAGERIAVGDLMAAIGATVVLDPRVDEALACLREAAPLPLARRRLGVSERSLERLLASQRQRGPLWWRNLARARRCARALAGAEPLAHVAAAYGYADQAHMARDLRRLYGRLPCGKRSFRSCGSTDRLRSYIRPVDAVRHTTAAGLDGDSRGRGPSVGRISHEAYPSAATALPTHGPTANPSLR